MFEVRNVTVRFGSTVALDDVSLQFSPGEAVIVRGPSGCGKTTLLRVIAGLTVPDTGEIWLQGSQASRPDFILPPHQRNLAFVFQEPRLWPHMTVRQNVMFGLAVLRPSERAERLALVADNTGIIDLLTRYPSELSGGQARRVALARALAPQRPLILMDEPLTNLDDAGRRDLVAVVRRFWEEEKFALLYVTHDALEEIPFARRIIRLDRGQLLTDEERGNQQIHALC
ncbi:MAG: ATP-binding cassette domain-containing protein [Nitrospirae bacterium]|nr:MAG: ATP-binding cassette domain-containing protein [Nitrospirota bacterium]